MKPLAIDLFCGLGGWTEGFLAEGYDVIGFDIERRPYPAQLVLQDVLTLHGSQFKDAAVIVASPPCQKYSYMAMPWTRAKKLADDYRSGVRSIEELNALFNACGRISEEARVPLIIENVRGAQPWVGPASWNYGSFYLWGDVPALMPTARALKVGRNFHQFEKTGIPSTTFQAAPHEHKVAVSDAIKTVGHVNKRDGHTHTRHLTNQRESDAVKNGGDWFGSGDNCSLQRRQSSKSSSRKAASAQIAKIPFPLALHIARCFKP